MEAQQFEELTYSRQYKPAASALLRLLDQFRQGGGMGKDEEDDCVALGAYTRMAAAITSLLGDPTFNLTVLGYQALCALHPQLSGIFRASAFGNADHIFRIVNAIKAEPDGGVTVSIQGEKQLMKLLLAYSIYSSLDLDFAAILSRAPDTALPAYLGALSQREVLSPQAHQNRQKLLDMAPLIDGATLSDDLLLPLAMAWMMCSYAEGQTKHDIKQHLNLLLQKWLAQKKVHGPDLPFTRSKENRPTLLVAAERFGSLHAMFRCYAVFIRQLRQKFRLVLMCEPHHMDEVSQSLFDQVVPVEFRPAEVRKLVGSVIKLNPAMIYYPSLGMSTWTILLANLRLAPIQFATLGHPATTRSPFIDYMIMGAAAYESADCFSEKVILLRNVGALYETYRDAVPIAPEIRHNPAPLKIAAMGRSFKISVPFLALCRRLVEKSGRVLELHFFPNETGLTHHQVKRLISAWLPGARIHAGTNYANYIENLNRCDICLGTFPFGNANGAVDSLRQGIPMVTLEGREPHARTEARVMRSVGIPEWLVTHDVEEYETAALRLIQNDDERVEISDMLVRNVDQALFSDEHNAHPDDFLDTVWWLYEHHELIQQDGRKVWMPDSREEMSVAAMATTVPDAYPK